MRNYEHPHTVERKTNLANEPPPLTEEMIEAAMLRAQKNGYPINARRLFPERACDESSGR